MDWIVDMGYFIVNTLLAEFIVVVVGVLVAQLILTNWEKWRYGKWRVIIRQGDKDLLVRDISPGKTRDVLDEPADLSVFLKGVVSPYGWINCDPLVEGKEIGLFVEDHQNRRFVIDLDKNPPSKDRRSEGIERFDL